MIKVGLVGIGGMGGCHFGQYKNIDLANVVAVADVRVDMAKEKVNDDNVHIYASIDELLKNEDVDVIDICTPSYMHKEMSIKALNSGKHVLCEKPMSLNSKDTKEVIDVVEKTGKLFMTAHVVRFMAPYMHLKEVIDNKKYGKLLRLDMKRLSAIPDWSWEDWMRDTTKSGGTPMDLSIHDIDFVQYILGQPKKVSAAYKKLESNNDFITSQLVYDDCVVTAEAGWFSYGLEFECGFTAIFESGMLTYKGGKLYENGEEVEVETGAISNDTGINISGVDGYGSEIEYYMNCVNQGIKPGIVTPTSSQDSVKLIERILDNAVIL